MSLPVKLYGKSRAVTLKFGIRPKNRDNDKINLEFSTVSPVTHNTMVSVTPSALTPVTPTQVYTETTEHGVLPSDPTPTQPTLEPENFLDLNNENSRFKFLLNEIRENERDIRTMQENINK